jgi:DNA-binding SARP family transcriptional activator
MSQLTLAFLGSPEVRQASRAIPFATRKALALLVYLAVERGTHARDKLTALFWPDATSRQGRTSLRTTLVYVRNALGEAAPHLAADRDTVRFEISPEIDLDLQDLHTAVRATRELALHSLSASSPTAVPPNLKPLMAQLKRAADRYRGDFLEGFSLADSVEFDNWASQQREDAHRAATIVFDWLSQLQSEGGELANAIETTRRWIAHDSLNEAAHRRLMQLHLANDDRAAALKAYEACRTILAHELNAEPGPETEALAKRIRAQQATAQRPARLAIPTVEAPLIGRAVEHHTLVTAYRLARQGQPQVVVIEGEPGIGKTRLAKEFLAWAVGQGADVLRSRAYETGSHLPYQPLVEALRFALNGERFNVLPPTWLAELSRLLPELHDHYPDLPPPLMVSEGEARMRLFEAVSRLGSALAVASSTVILFIDDLQWADAATLELTLYTVRRWASANLPTLLLFTLRSDDVATNPALGNWLTDLERHVPLTRIVLGPLTEEDTAKLIREMRDWGLAPSTLESLIASVYHETGGHPFFLLQTLRLLSESGTVTSVERLATPKSVRELIRSRLVRLSPNALATCHAGAVLGSGFDVERLCQVADLSESDSLIALEELLARGLWRETDRLAFAHDKIREVTYAEISASRRRILHRRALEALEAIMPPTSAAERARHALAAGLTERAFQLSIAAGDEALHLFAVRDAIAQYERALTLAPTAPLQSLHLQLGRAYQLATEWDKARAAYDRALSLAREARQPHTECVALNHLATLAAYSSFDLGTAASLLKEAQHVAERCGDKARLAETEHHLAEINFYAWNLPLTHAHAERAQSLARETGQQELVADTLSLLGWTGLVTGQREEEVVAWAEEAQAIYATLGNRAMEAYCLSLEAAVHVHWGQLQAGIAAGRAGLAISLEIENERGHTNNAYNLALGLLDAGEYTAALEVAQAGVTRARSGHPPTLVFNLLTLGAIYRALFALEAAHTTHLEAKRIADGLRQPFVSEWVVTELCADYVLAGNWVEAHRYAQQARSLRNYKMAYPGFTRWCETEALVQGGDAEQAAEDLRRMSEQPNWFNHNRRYRVQYVRARAALAQWRDNQREAITYLHEAASLADSIGLPGELWHIYTALGEKDRANDIAQSLAANVHKGLRETFLAGVSNALRNTR